MSQLVPYTGLVSDLVRAFDASSSSPTGAAAVQTIALLAVVNETMGYQMGNWVIDKVGEVASLMAHGWRKRGRAFVAEVTQTVLDALAAIPDPFPSLPILYADASELVPATTPSSLWSDVENWHPVLLTQRMVTSVKSLFRNDVDALAGEIAVTPFMQLMYTYMDADHRKLYWAERLHAECREKCRTLQHVTQKLKDVRVEVVNTAIASMGVVAGTAKIADNALTAASVVPGASAVASVVRITGGALADLAANYINPRNPVGFTLTRDTGTSFATNLMQLDVFEIAALRANQASDQWYDSQIGEIMRAADLAESVRVDAIKVTNANAELHGGAPPIALTSAPVQQMRIAAVAEAAADAVMEIQPGGEVVIKQSAPLQLTPEEFALDNAITALQTNIWRSNGTIAADADVGLDMATHVANGVLFSGRIKSDENAVWWNFETTFAIATTGLWTAKSWAERAFVFLEFGRNMYTTLAGIGTLGGMLAMKKMWGKIGSGVIAMLRYTPLERWGLLPARALTTRDLEIAAAKKKEEDDERHQEIIGLKKEQLRIEEERLHTEKERLRVAGERNGILLQLIDRQVESNRMMMIQSGGQIVQALIETNERRIASTNDTSARSTFVLPSTERAFIEELTEIAPGDPLMRTTSAMLRDGEFDDALSRPPQRTTIAAVVLDSHASEEDRDRVIACAMLGIDRPPTLNPELMAEMDAEVFGPVEEEYRRKIKIKSANRSAFALTALAACMSF